MKGQKTSVPPEGATASPPKLAAGTQRVLVPPGPSASVEALAQAEAPAQYPSESLIRSTSEDNQIPSHLPACPSLRHIASLRGRAVVEFFHSSIAEVGLAHPWRKVALPWAQPQVLRLLDAGFSPSFSSSRF